MAALFHTVAKRSAAVQLEVRNGRHGQHEHRRPRRDGRPVAQRHAALEIPHSASPARRPGRRRRTGHVHRSRLFRSLPDVVDARRRIQWHHQSLRQPLRYSSTNYYYFIY